MTNGITILDGGMGRQLARIGAPFRMPEWSALALIEAPEFVKLAHDQFIAAGAEVITTNSYSVLPHQIGAALFNSDGYRLADLAGRLAHQAAVGAGRKVRVAGSIPPPFGSYQPGKFDAARAPAILDVLAAALAPHVDQWLIETQSSLAEARAAIEVVSRHPRPIWISFTLKDEIGRRAPAELRSGESVQDAFTAAVRWGAQAVLFNCSQPEAMEAAVRDAAAARLEIDAPDIGIGVYANTFEPEPPSDAAYAGLSEMRGDLSPATYLDFVRAWITAGADIVGGCCGIGPEHIAEITQAVTDGQVAAPRRAARHVAADPGCPVCQA